MVDLATEDWRRVLDVNLTAAFQMGREAARRMIARGRGGKMINIGSLTSAVARATVAPYTAAKGGIKMLTQSMAAEWAAHDIQANAIGPGYIVTEMNRALIDDAKFDAWVRSRTPSGRWGKPEDLDRRGGVPRLARLGLCQRANPLRRRRPFGRHVKPAGSACWAKRPLETAMRGVIIHAPKDLRVEETPDQALGPNDVRVRIRMGGICGSDLHYYNHGGSGFIRLKEPMVLGHEVAGTSSANWDRRSRILRSAPASHQPEPPLRAVPVLRRRADQPLPGHALHG